MIGLDLETWTSELGIKTFAEISYIDGELVRLLSRGDRRMIDLRGLS